MNYCPPPPLPLTPMPESEAAMPQLRGWFEGIIVWFTLWDLQIPPEVPVPGPVSAVPQTRDK